MNKGEGISMIHVERLFGLMAADILRSEAEAKGINEGLSETESLPSLEEQIKCVDYMKAHCALGAEDTIEFTSEESTLVMLLDSGGFLLYQDLLSESEFCWKIKIVNRPLGFYCDPKYSQGKYFFYVRNSMNYDNLYEKATLHYYRQPHNLHLMQMWREKEFKDFVKLGKKDKKWVYYYALPTLVCLREEVREPYKKFGLSLEVPTTTAASIYLFHKTIGVEGAWVGDCWEPRHDIAFIEREDYILADSADAIWRYLERKLNQCVSETEDVIHLGVIYNAVEVDYWNTYSYGWKNGKPFIHYYVCTIDTDRIVTFDVVTNSFSGNLLALDVRRNDEVVEMPQY